MGQASWLVDLVWLHKASIPNFTFLGSLEVPPYYYPGGGGGRRNNQDTVVDVVFVNVVFVALLIVVNPIMFSCDQQMFLLGSRG